MITEFAREVLKKFDVKLVVEGEKEEAFPPAKNEAEVEGKTAPTIATVGEKCEV